MSQLIQLKQRIKAIKVIKKITHAMRLIAMSSHSKLKRNSENLKLFRDEIAPILCTLEKGNKAKIESKTESKKHLWILIASEKGLCGNFNSVIFAYFDRKIKNINKEEHRFIAIGKRAADHLKQKNIDPIATYQKLSPNKLENTASQIYEKVIEIKDEFETIQCFYNQSQSFFIQAPCQFQLLPINTIETGKTTSCIDIEKYDWPQKPADVINCLFQSLLKLNILHLISESMISEQSSRFLSMDSSTRSADNLLKSMNLEYNKIRQTKITKELTELVSSF